MRRVVAIVLVAVLAGLAAGCGGSSESASQTTTGASSCAKDSLNLVTPGRLTIGTGNPAFPPWFEGGTKPGSSFKVNDPTTGKGYDEVVWKAVAFNQTYKPGPKSFDFAMQQISYDPQRAQAVDFSRSYYDVNQALVALQDSSIANATSVADLEDAKLGAVIGTTSYRYIVDNIQPSKQPSVYDTLSDNVAALKNGQIDGLVTDFPTAYYIANVQLSNAKLVGRFPTAGKQEYFGLTFEKGNSLVDCVDKALDSLDADGTLDRLEQQWITSKAHAPLIQD